MLTITGCLTLIQSQTLQSSLLYSNCTKRFPQECCMLLESPSPHLQLLQLLYLKGLSLSNFFCNPHPSIKTDLQSHFLQGNCLLLQISWYLLSIPLNKLSCISASSICFTFESFPSTLPYQACYGRDCCCYYLVTQSSATPWTVAHQASLSMGFLRQQYCSGLPFPSPGNPLSPEIEPKSSALAGRFFTTVPPGKTQSKWSYFFTNPHKKQDTVLHKVGNT